MTGAYLLAEELAGAENDVAGALTRYEAKLKPGVEKRQAAGRRLAYWFVPDTPLRIAIRDLVMRMAAWPVASSVIKRLLIPESILTP
jgi:2-polyprenyl-6-methoxyphenol hydroxylase-like FAD-dependent oxidoreductase